MKVDNVGVHVTHCCILHGCKYGDDDCPVTKAIVPQKYTCESCDYDKMEIVEAKFSELQNPQRGLSKEEIIKLIKDNLRINLSWHNMWNTIDIEVSFCDDIFNTSSTSLPGVSS